MPPDPILDSLKGAEASAGAGGASQIQDAAGLIPHARVLDPKGVSLQQMQAWPHIVDLVTDFWPNNPRTVIKKARQLGVSWAFALYCLHHCGWKSYRTLGSVNTTKDTAAELIYRMKVLWSVLPRHLRPPADFGTHKAEFGNGSRAIALATTDVSGAGYTFSLMGVDEAALIGNLGDNWAALLPAVDQGQLHLFSTARDDSTKFHEIQKAAQAGDSIFKYRWLNWDLRPDRDQSTPEGRAWLKARREELSPREFAREYEGQETRPGTAYFDDETLDACRKTCRDPKQVLWGGRLKIYSRPSSNVVAVIGADVAEGLQDGDYSAADVLDRRTGEQLASYHAHIGVTEYAEELARLGKLYGFAWQAVEANNHGHAVCAWLYKKLRYKRLLRESREAEGQLASQSQYRLGVLTTNASKPAMLAELEHGLRKGTIIVRDKDTVGELASFIGLPGGGYGASPGNCDDKVMSLTLAQHARGRKRPKSA